MKIKKLLLVLSLAMGISYAQSDTTFFAGVKELQEVFDKANYAPVGFTDTSLRVIDQISKRRNSDKQMDRSVYLEKQKELIERDYGLAITGSYLENINPTIGDLEDNLFYSRKFSAGVEWNLLNDGYFENQVQSRILEDKIQRSRMMNDATDESFHYLERFDYTIYIFNKVKIELLNERKQQLEKQYDIVSELVYLKKLTKEEIINLQTRLAEVESLINVYKSYNDYLGVQDDSATFDIENLPLIDLNYEHIFSLLEMQTDSLLSTSVYEDYYSWYHQVNLSPYLRYNYYDLIGDSYRNYFTAGLTFSMPIPFNHKLQNEIESEKWKYDNEKLVQNRINLQEDILNTGYEFRYKLKQFISFYQKRVLFMERLRIEKVKVRLGDVNVDPLGGLDLYDDLVQIDIELVDLLQNLYLKALKIHSRIPHADIRDIVINQTTEQMSEYLDKKNRAVYVWSKTFESGSAVFLAEYAVYNAFSDVLISVEENDTLRKEKSLFMNYAAENGNVYFMLGNNNLMFEEDPLASISRILKAYDGFVPEGIHLDIEPHTFEEWGSDKQRLINQYLEFVGKVSTYCKENELELAVSIPLHYGPEVVDQLLGMTDQVYFMCYENVKIDYLVNKLTTYTDNALEKLFVALRTEDFTSRMEMEEKVNEIEKRTGITNFAYHDLRRMIAFDRKSIE
ncbi:MAG: hypothetical protein HYZ14_09825 [Bacteroidetes bacterium]|nr:hypothetical protein [Bacteroidota bacterium]